MLYMDVIKYCYAVWSFAKHYLSDEGSVYYGPFCWSLCERYYDFPGLCKSGTR